MTTPPGQEPQYDPTRRGGPLRPAPRGADSGWPGSGGDARRGAPGRGPGGSPRDSAGPRRAGYGGAPGAAGPARGSGRPEPDPRRQGRSGPGPGSPAERSWGGQRGAEPVPRGGGTPRGTRAAGTDDFGDRRRAPGRGPAAPVDQPPGLRPGPTVRWLGTLAARTAVLILLGATLLGVAGTIVTHREPGGLLGFFVILGAVIATLAIRRRRLHILIPLPALMIFVGAVVTGAVHDRGADSSLTEMGANSLQWIASVFFVMCAATIVVLVIAGARWLPSRQLVSGQFRVTADRGGADRRPPPRPAPGLRPGAAAKPGSRPDGGRPGRDDRGGRRPNWDERDDRGAWGNPGRPVDRDPWGEQWDDDDRRGANGRRAGPSQRGDPNQRGDRPSFTPLNQGEPRNPRNDRPRPTY